MITPSHLPYNRNGFKFLLIFKHFFSERSAAVDSSGREFNRNRLIALLSAIFLEQIRVSGFGGWFLLRLSLHDPFLPLNIEAQSEDDAVKLGLVVANAVKEFNALDTSALSSLTRS
ncbi:BnaC05g36900D [Brassica napus]|uniref:BnaC05g36900D protein n=1 Tax=Brassica napus TaxID=3708 RepID=A0A078HYX5_BRANA|nr:BnaC05g36900D [Brassica napus]